MSQQITLHDLPLPGLKLIKRHQLGDYRGFLQRMYCKDMLSQYDIKKPISQINHTLTREVGSVRGMHFQHAPHAEMKIVTCLRGKVFDVAVDLRKNSPTFLQWHAEILSPELNNSMLIPEGFAHGFQALSNDCELLYLHTAAYNQQAEGGLSPIDPVLGIVWPLEVIGLSERDKSHPRITANYEGINNEV